MLIKHDKCKNVKQKTGNVFLPLGLEMTALDDNEKENEVLSPAGLPQL